MAGGEGGVLSFFVCLVLIFLSYLFVVPATWKLYLRERSA